MALSLPACHPPTTIPSRTPPHVRQLSRRSIARAQRCRTFLLFKAPASLIICGVSAASSNGNGAAPSVRVTLDTEEAKASLRFTEVEMDRGSAIIIDSVAPGSVAEQEGVQPRQRVLAISSPMVGAEMWSLDNRPSLRFVREAVTTLRRGASVVLDLTAEPIAEEPREAMGSAASTGAFQSELFDSVSGPESSSDGEREEGGETIADKLQRKYLEDEHTAAREETARQRRIQRRRDYMERDSQRNDAPLIIGVLAAFLLPSILILGYAFSTGYLDKLGGGYNSY